MLGQPGRSLDTDLGSALFRHSQNTPYRAAMRAIGSRIEETGMLIREEGGFALRRDAGGRVRLDLHRVSDARVDRRVRITGVVVGEGLIDVTEIGDA